MLCGLVILVLLGVIGYQNFSRVKGFVQEVIAKAKGGDPQPPAPPTTPTV